MATRAAFTPDTSRELGESVRQVVSAFVRQVRTATSSLRTAQWETLELLETLGPLTVAQLARHRGVKHQSMRLVVAELASDGLVDRHDDPDDARAQQVVISESARARLKTARDERAAWIAARIDSHLDAADRQALSAGLDVLRRLTASGDP